MGTLIIFALAMLADTLLTAWLIFRFSKGLSPIPSIPRKVEVTGDEPENHEPVYQRGRPIL